MATSSSSYGRGIIPTRVGTSTHLRAKSLSAQDHPHACGDKQLATCFTTLTLGSSPRVWGQVRCAAAILRVERIIPTRVGTSFFSCFFSDIAQDHPHACGDKSNRSCFHDYDLSSSPRVWGQVFDIFSAAIATGIIPTRVGTRTADYSSDALSRDHPHACGDKLS